MKNIFLIVSFFFACNTLFGQDGWEAGVSAGTAHYFGDLNTSVDIGLPGLSAGIAARYNFNERIALKFSATKSRVFGDDARSNNLYEQARNLSFRSDILDGSAQMEFNFLPYYHGSKDFFYTPYLLAGISVLSYNPQAEYKNKWVDLRPLGTEGQFRGDEYYTITGGWLYGAGFKIDLTYEWSLNIEVAARRLFTDYLDDVSTVYTDKRDLEQLRGLEAVALSDPSILIPGVNEGNLGDRGRQRGNSSNNDTYVITSVSILYYFGDIKCPAYGSRKRR